MKKKAKPLFLVAFLVLLALIPLGIEGLLRFTGAGIETEPFQHPDRYPQVWIDNLEAYQKYYPKMTNRGQDLVIPNIFDTEKAPGTLRGFIIGGSTAQGFPFAANQSFAKLAENALRQAGVEVEILNVGRSAMSSYYVRDMAPKLLRYDPDFLVIYAGHNDYYGTISASTGGSHWTRLLNLSLKESRLFQLLFDALAPSPPPLKEGETRMAQQFADKVIPPDPVLDAQVAQDFLDNIQAATRPYLDNKLPVFLMLPVSNLEMPPFNSEKQGLYQTQIQDVYQNMKDGKYSEARNLLAELEASGAGENAHVLYLKAQLHAQETGQSDLALLDRAKDRDTSPFRARSPLVNALRSWAQATPGVVLVDTPQFLKNEGASLTKEIFIDHLHFNFQGQKLVAKGLVEGLARSYSWPEDQKTAAREFFAQPGRPEKSVYLTDYFSWRAISGVEKLVAAPPYQFMILPPDFGLEAQKKGNLLFENEELRTGLASVPSADQLSRLLSWYSSTNQLEALNLNLYALAATDRGNPEPPRMLAELFDRSPEPSQRARAGEFYLKAYLLSGRDPILFERLRKVLQETGQNDLFLKIRNQFPPAQ